MKIDDKIRHVNLKHNINREAAKISVLSWGKIEKYEYFTGKEYHLITILSKSNPTSNQVYISSFRENLQKTKKNNWRSRK